MIYRRSATWWYEFEFNGRRVRGSAHTRNKEIARQIEAAHKIRLAKGEAGIAERPPAPTLKEFAPRFMQAIRTLCASKPATIRFYASKLTAVLGQESLANLRLDQIDEQAIDAYKMARTSQLSWRRRFYSPASVNRELATLRRLLRLACDWKVIDRAPRIHLLRGEHGREFVLSREQEKLYLAMAPQPLHDIAILLLDAGLRISEALSLDWANVRLTPAPGASLGYLTIRWEHSKNAKTRQVSLTERAAKMLAARGPARSGLVFSRNDGAPLAQTYLNEQHNAIRKALKFPREFVPHSLRHTFGTRIGERGADAFTIMKIMGHSTVTVSQRYVHPTPETMERAIRGLEDAGAEFEDRAARVPPKSPTVKKRGRTDIQ